METRAVISRPTRGIENAGAHALAVWLASAVVLLVIWSAASHAWAQSAAPGYGAVSAANSADPSNPSQIALLVGRSTILNVGAPITRVSLTTPDVADAMVTSSQQLLIHGKAPGTISMFVWDRAGAIRTYEVVVRRDLSQLAEQLRQLFPGEQIGVASNGRDVVISGTVTSKYVVEKAADVASGYVEKKDNVVNLVRQVEGVASNQIMLRVRFAEVSRSALQELGSSFFTGPTGYKDYISRVTTEQFAAPNFRELERKSVIDENGNEQVTELKGKFDFSDFLNLFLFNTKYNVGTLIRALQTRGLFQSLAEPNLIAQNGKEASFLAGGEYPYPAAQGGANNLAITIVFKEFGIRLSFTPTVLGGDLIHLKVRPEVSSLDFTNAVSFQGFRVPSLSTRRAETEVELRDGQTFAIAGLLNNTMTSAMQKIPGIGDIPVLGLLFKSRALQKAQTELVVMITPQILRRDSTGVAPGLPNLVEPYLTPPRRTLPPPPPYAPKQEMSGAMPAPSPSAPSKAPVNAGTPAPAAPAQPPPVGALPPAITMTPAEKAAFERARADAMQRQDTSGMPVVSSETIKQEKAALEKARKEREKEEKVARRKAEETRQQEEKLARERAKRDAEMAKREAEAAKKQAELDKKRAKAVAEAEARLKAAQDAYQAELKRTEKREKQ